MRVTREIVREIVESKPEPPKIGLSQVSQDLGQVGHGAPRPKTAAQKVREHLKRYPEDASMPVRELADRIGVGKSTVQRVLKEGE